MHILLLEPFFSGSHKSWAEELVKYSSHTIEILSLEGRFWKWRMHGGAISLAKEYLKREIQPNLILATDMLDLNLFLSLTREKTASIPCAIYFHENQITYPWSPNDSDVKEGKDLHYGFINYASALSADNIFFNSKFHRESFLTGCEELLKKFPDHRELSCLEKLQKKSSVLSLGVELSRFDQYEEVEDEAPLILWNHRWEYDKNPDLFFKTLYQLKQKGLGFKLCVLGQRGERVPEIFEKLPELFQDELVQLGPVNSFEEYASWLWRSNIHPTTSNQDFFGISVVEGAYCGCRPLLPKRLAYPEHIADALAFYEDDAEFEQKLGQLIEENSWNKSYAKEVKKYDWSHLISIYDEAFERLSKLSRR